MLAIAAIIVGLALLVWSADRFVLGASESASQLGVPPLLIGMVVIGFGTSAPEMMVSAMAATDGNPGLALGNAYGSNIANIALILGLTALVIPLVVRSSVLRSELPLLAGITAIAAWQLSDGDLSFADAMVLLVLFFAAMTWAAWQSRQHGDDALASETAERVDAHALPLRQAIFWLVVGLVVLIASSRLLVWGAVSVAQSLGVSDLIIGLTIVAVGTSLPELASSLAAARKGEDDLAVGNILGSNLFNTLAVVGIAGAIHPLAVPPEVLSRDLLLVGALTALLFVYGFRKQGDGRIGRVKGATLLLIYIAYTGYLVQQAVLS